MSKFIVVVFDDEKSAYEGSRALAELHQEGSLAVFAAAVISKDADGTVSVHDADNQGAVGTLTGTLLGGLIGVLGGPIGMLAGASAGALGGWMYDIYNLGVDGQYLQDVSTVLTAGKSAVVAEVTEGWTTPLDSRMSDLGGLVFRRQRIDVEDEQIEREIKATNDELDELEAELNQAADDAKAHIETKVAAAQAKLKTLQDKATAKAESMKNEIDSKLATIDEQIAKCSDDTKAKFEKRKAELKADFERRAEKLKKAAELTQQALAQQTLA